MVIVLCMGLCACSEDHESTGKPEVKDTVGKEDVFAPDTQLNGGVMPELLFRNTFAAGQHGSIGISDSGEVFLATSSPVGYVFDGNDIVTLDMYTYCLAVKRDGTVVAKSISSRLQENFMDMNNVAHWSDIVDVAAGNYHNVGLKSDGTVVYAGSISEEEAAVLDSWTDIIAIDAAEFITVGLKADGTAVVCGLGPDVSAWTDIVEVSASSNFVLGLKSDGTVVAASGRKAEDPRSDVSSWTNIVAICAGLNHCVGLKNDGTVVSTKILDEDFDLGQCNVGEWTDIVAISANYTHTLGLKSDGTIVAAGADYEEGCNVSGWGKVQIP